MVHRETVTDNLDKYQSSLKEDEIATPGTLRDLESMRCSSPLSVPRTTD